MAGDALAGDLEPGDPVRGGENGPAPLRIRRYRWSDLDAVWSLHQMGLAQVGVVPGDGVYYDDDFPRITEVYLRAGGDFLVGEVPGAGLVAMGGLRRIDADTAEMCLPGSTPITSGAATAHGSLRSLRIGRATSATAPCAATPPCVRWPRWSSTANPGGGSCDARYVATTW